MCCRCDCYTVSVFECALPRNQFWTKWVTVSFPLLLFSMQERPLQISLQNPSWLLSCRRCFSAKLILLGVTSQKIHTLAGCVDLQLLVRTAVVQLLLYNSLSFSSFTLFSPHLLVSSSHLFFLLFRLPNLFLCQFHASLITDEMLPHYIQPCSFSPVFSLPLPLSLLLFYPSAFLFFCCQKKLLNLPHLIILVTYVPLFWCFLILFLPLSIFCQQFSGAWKERQRQGKTSVSRRYQVSVFPCCIVVFSKLIHKNTCAQTLGWLTTLRLLG